MVNKEQQIKEWNNYAQIIELSIFCRKTITDNAKIIPLKTTEQKVRTRDAMSSATLTFEKKSFFMYLLNDNRISEGNMFRRCNQINIAR